MSSSEASTVPIINVPREAYREFFEGLIWTDLKDILEGRLKYARAVLDTEKDHIKLIETQGAIAELRYLLDLEETIMEDYTFEAGKETIPLALEGADNAETE